MRPQQYRRVKEEDQEEDYPSTLHSSSSYLLPCVLLILLLLSISLALIIFIHPWKPSTTPTTLPPTTTMTTTTLGPNVSDHHHNHNHTGTGFSFNETLNGTLEGDILESETQLKTHLIQLIRKTEKFMEKWTGMEGELLIPVFMLLCFLSSVSIVSLCCCIMTKRREARRRQLFGKIITDLQTGDSKTVLLNHSDLED